jgi:hypothetical protein
MYEVARVQMRAVKRQLLQQAPAIGCQQVLKEIQIRQLSFKLGLRLQHCGYALLQSCIKGLDDVVSFVQYGWDRMYVDSQSVRLH